METYKDEELVKLFQEGNKKAQEQLLLRYQKTVRSCARKFFLKGGETEDLIQVGMIGLAQAVADYQEIEGMSFKNFAYLCVYRRIVDEVKKASGQNNPLNDALPISDGEGVLCLDPERSILEEDERRELNELMSRVLTDMEFKVFTMYMDGATNTEICTMTGKEYKSVDNAVQRSKEKLRKTLVKRKDGEK
ncbi:MAG: sigma-70 family RNA polymerase sigma factor [Clostridiales bacterium]|nr:sigma-70 family RNA polymerase sigma factor [Clostridiales bacterium]